MRALSATELLDAWEQGIGQTPTRRATALLASACPERSPDALARLSIGQRDARLLTLREWTFGAMLLSLATCPGCGEQLELRFDTADIRASAPPEGEGQGESPSEFLSLTADGYEVQFRLPTGLDLEAIAVHDDVVDARQALLQRCLLKAHSGDGEAEAGPLPAAVESAVVETMARADPQAEVVLDLACPACDQRWQAVFDIASFFWTELDAWARRTLHEVHLLASAYGWREAEILALSPWRRQAYLELVG